MEFLNSFMVPVIVGICLIVGFIIKQWINDVDNKWIPTIVSVVGVVMAVWLNTWQLTPEVILSGLASGLASTGMYELLRQYIEKD